jgi:hypothetical protein
LMGAAGRSRGLVLAFGLVWLGFAGVGHTQGEPTTVRSLSACIHDSQGKPRVVEPGETCRTGETKVELVGEQGPVGPAGPAGLPGLVGAPAICESQCARGTLEVHFTETDSSGNAVCPSEPEGSPHFANGAEKVKLAGIF